MNAVQLFLVLLNKNVKKNHLTKSITLPYLKLKASIMIVAKYFLDLLEVMSQYH